jgi:SapC
LLELLNNIQHQDLRVITRRGARWGDAVMSCPVIPDEFRSLQAHYPVVFQPDGNGSFLPVALFGLVEGENLFLDGDKWDADFIPLSMRRLPFSIGVAGDDLRVMVDMASPRVTRGPDGEALFLPQGGMSEFLEQSNSVLHTLHEGFQALPDYVSALVEHRLLESFVLDVERPDGTHGQLQGYHMIHEERLAALDAATIGLLHEADYLQPTYMAIASLSNLSRMIRAHLAREARPA